MKSSEEVRNVVHEDTSAWETIDIETIDTTRWSIIMRGNDQTIG